MKEVTFLFMVFTIYCESTWCQSGQMFRGANWSTTIFKDNPEAYEGYPETEVNVNLSYLNFDNNLLYKEFHLTTLNRFSQLNVRIGEGTPDPESPGPIENVDFSKVNKLAFMVTVPTRDGDKVVSGEHRIGNYPVSEYSERALNARSLGNNRWEGAPVSLDQMLDAPDGIYCIPMLQSQDITLSIDKVFNVTPFTDLLRRKLASSIVTKEEVPYTCLGTGTNRPVVFGTGVINDIQNYFTFCSGPLDRFWHAMAVKVPGFINGTSNHNTAALFLENFVSPKSIGLYAKGGERGIFSEGAEGVSGLSSTNVSGAGVAGYIPVAPQAGGFKYAVAGYGSTFANTYAGMFFGDIAHTGDIFQVSDRRLKTNIRSHQNALDVIKRLKPSQYYYSKETPYNLPGGLHHGFIAQELEEVLPELVQEVTMPGSIKPDEIHSSKAESYKTVSYTELIPILTAAIKELNAKVDAQAAEIQKLKKSLQTGQSPK